MIRKFTFLAALALAGCAGLTPGTASPGTAGAPATAGQLAQTVSGQQGQAPATATGGTSSILWNFASQGAAEIQTRILALAEAGKWTPEQLTAALASTNGAPQTVNITTQTNSSNGGTASSIPAGTGGAAGVGGSGTITKP
jgi:hypothetical protein